jgi:cell division protein FtsN
VAPARVASALDRPFVQIGIFSVEANATGARNQMQAAGLNAEIRRGQANEREFWRVVVGPASDQAGRGQILERVRAMGFADAYAVVR